MSFSTFRLACDMVKGRGSSSSSERPSSWPPSASLSLASAHQLKPSIRPSPLFSLLKRPPFSRTEERSMNARSLSSSPPPPSIYNLESYKPEDQLCTDVNFADIATASATASARLSNNCTDMSLVPPVDDDDDDEDDDDDDDDDGPGSDKELFLCGRQRLQQHRLQVSGKVTIPDTWGSEKKLQEWVSYGIVEDALRPAGLMSARKALVSECQRRGGKPVRTSARPAMSADVEVS